MAVRDSLKNYIIKPFELKKKLNLSNIKVFDCRWYLDKPKKGECEFKRSHLEGAYYFDIESISNTSSNLPHMFPSNQQFTMYARSCGVSKNDSIIIYDQNGFFCSSRVWLMFLYFGFKNVKILDGGFREWRKHKLPLTKKIKKRNFRFLYSKIKDKNIIIDKRNIERLIHSKNKNLKIIDARSKERFLGIVSEPRPNLVKGNIPGSINISFKSIVKENGRLLELVKLKEFFFNKENIKIKNDIICYCGSGVTACNIFFILKILGFKKIKLYDGSWSEWGKKI